MIRHVLVARSDNDGDVLLAGPAIRAAAAGSERVTLLAGPRGRGAAALLPGIDEVLVWRLPWIDPEPAPVARDDVLALAAAIAERAPDQAVILTSYHQSPLPLALVLRLAGVARIAAISADYPGSLLDVRHRIDDDVHEVERSLSLLDAAGFPLPAGDDGRLAVIPGRAPDGLPQGYVVVHPGASVPARAWDPLLHRDLVERLRRAGHAVVVTGGPDETALTRGVSGPPRPGVVDLGGRTTLAELAGVLARARAVVVGNTGPAHLSAAVGAPVAWLHADTIPAVRWHPWRVPYVRLTVPVPCAGCRARVCPVPGHPCIDEVPVASVVEAVERLAGPAGIERAA